MTTIQRTVLSLFLMAVAGCSTMTVVKGYEGPEREASQLATLQLDPHVLVARVDKLSKHPSGGARVLASSAGKRRETLAVTPGPHEIVARFFVLCVQSEELTLSFVAERGVQYRLKAEADLDRMKWSAAIVPYSGEPVEDTLPWLKAACPNTWSVVTLKR